jgi:hypothetical protein
MHLALVTLATRLLWIDVGDDTSYHRVVAAFTHDLGPPTCHTFFDAQWDGPVRVVVFDEKTRVDNHTIVSIEWPAPRDGACRAE